MLRSIALPFLIALLLAPVLSHAVPVRETSRELSERLRRESLQAATERALQPTNEVENRRPTGPDGPYGINYGGVVPSVYDAGPDARIWYVTSGPHAVLPEDRDDSGVPDLVESLADMVAEVTLRLDADGWRRPLTDLDRGLPDFGGDGRFDIYLVDFAKFQHGSDGFLFTEYCEGSAPQVCGGFIAIENDFVGYNYPSIEEAVRTLFSHEYAHAIGAAYAAGTSSWWDEGQATWAEWAYADVEVDVIRLARRWFTEPERPLDDPAGPSAWAYAGSTFVLQLSERHGLQVVQDAWQALADARAVTAVRAVDEVLIDRGSTIREEWERFAAAAWFTQDRVTDAPFEPLPFASELSTLSPQVVQVTELPFEHRQPKWSAQYVRFEGLGALTEALVVRPCEGEPPMVGVQVITGGTEREGLTVGAEPFSPRDSDVFVLTGEPRRSANHCVRLYDAADAPPVSCEGEDCEAPCEEGEDCETPCESEDCEAPCEEGADCETPNEEEPDEEDIVAPPGSPGCGCNGATAMFGPLGLLLPALLMRRRRGS